MPGLIKWAGISFCFCIQPVPIDCFGWGICKNLALYGYVMF